MARSRGARGAYRAGAPRRRSSADPRRASDRPVPVSWLPAGKGEGTSGAIDESRPFGQRSFFTKVGPASHDTLTALDQGSARANGGSARDQQTSRGMPDRYRPRARRPIWSNAISKGGDLVVVVGPPLETETASDEELDLALDEALKKLSPSRAAAEVAERLNIPRKRAYARALERSQ